LRGNGSTGHGLDKPLIPQHTLGHGLTELRLVLHQAIYHGSAMRLTGLACLAMLNDTSTVDVVTTTGLGCPR